MTEFAQSLLDTAPDARRVLIHSRGGAISEADIQSLADQARAMARSDPAESLRIADLAREVADVLDRERGRAIALRARAVALWAQGRLPEALEAFESGARTAERAGDPLLAAQIPILAVETLAQTGRHEEALQLAASLEQRLRALGADEDAMKVVANAGNIHFEREAFHEALDCWQRALSFFQERGKPVAVASLQVNVANVLTHLSRLPEALETYTAARSTLEQAGMDAVVAGLEGNAGFLHLMAGRYTEALQAYERARGRFEKLVLPRDIAKCRREIGDVYLELNLAPEARESFEHALPIFGDLQMSGESARCRYGLAVALEAMGRRAEALEALEQAEHAFRRDANEIGVARALLQRAEWRRTERPDGAAGGAPASETARAEAEEALGIFRRRKLRLGELQARLFLAELRVEDSSASIPALRRLLRDARSAGYVAWLWRIEAALARASLNAGKPRAALIHYRRAMQEVERARLLLQGDDFRMAFLQDKIRLYEELLTLLLDRGSAAALREGFELAERAKSRTLVERLAGAVSAERDGSPERQRLVSRLETLRAQLRWDYGRLHQEEAEATRFPAADAALPERLRRLEAEYLDTRRRLQIADPASGRLADADTTTVAGLQELLGEDEQIVEYVTARDEVLAFVLDRKRFRTVRSLASRAELEEQAERLRFQWSKFGPGSCAGRYAAQVESAASRALRTLYEMLVEPLEPLLPGRRLTIIPHGVLHGIPFHALHDGAGYAVDRWELAYAPSGAVYRACRLRPEPRATRSLFFGVSDPGIAHVREEIAGLRELFDDIVVYQDRRATLAAVPTEGTYRFIHFATHAVFRPDNPLFSGLRLTDGWLVAHDLYRRRLHCELATLSACRTGMSRVTPGDEVLGLARAFLSSGAQAVLVSLWAADDRVTAELMQACYRGLAAGMRRAEALREAQRDVRRRHPHPYHWAPFVLVGAR